MNRRTMLKALGGALAVATLPIPLPPTVVAETNEFYSDGEKAFVVIRAPHHVEVGRFVFWNGKPLGVACDDARIGRRVLVQVYGPATVRTA